MRIQEFADRVGVKRQAVYQRLKREGVDVSSITDSSGQLTTEGVEILSRFYGLSSLPPTQGEIAERIRKLEERTATPEELVTRLTRQILERPGRKQKPPALTDNTSVNIGGRAVNTPVNMHKTEVNTTVNIPAEAVNTSDNTPVNAAVNALVNAQTWVELYPTTLAIKNILDAARSTDLQHDEDGSYVVIQDQDLVNRTGRSIAQVTRAKKQLKAIGYLADKPSRGGKIYLLDMNTQE